MITNETDRHHGYHNVLGTKRRSRSEQVDAARESSGFPAPENANGPRTMPFRSRRSRAQRAIECVDGSPSSRV